MRRTLIGVLLIGLSMLAWYLNDLLYHSAWVNHYGPGMDPEIIRGWSILLAAWPLALVGVLGGAALALVVMIFAYIAGEDADHTREIEEWKQAAIETREHIEREFEERRKAIEELRVLSYQRIEQAERREQAVKLREQMLDMTLAAAYNERDTAYEERNKAIQAARGTKFACERKVKQAEDRQAKLNSTNNPSFSQS